MYSHSRKFTFLEVYILMKNKNPDECKNTHAIVSNPTESRRFTIKSFLFWTAVVVGLITAVRSGEQDVGTGIFITGVYLTVVCGITTLVLYPRSFDAYIPICGTILLLALLFLSAALLPMGKMRDTMGNLLFFSSLPLGIYLLIHNVRRINNIGFSLVVSIYHFGFWVAWVGLTGAIANAPIT